MSGKVSSKREIDIRIANETLGANKSAALLDFQAFTDVIKLANFVESLSWPVEKYLQLLMKTSLTPSKDLVGDKEDDTIRDGLVQVVIKLYLKQVPKKGLK